MSLYGSGDGELGWGHANFLFFHKQKDESANKLVPLIVETNDIDVTNNEAVLKNGKAIGYVTSGGFAHFTNKSVAFSYLDSKEISLEKGIQVEINGDFPGYGYRRIERELRSKGHLINHKKVLRLMKKFGIESCHVRKKNQFQL